MIARLNISADGGEQLVYNAPNFPVRCVDGDLSRFYNYAAGCHWHNDFEILIAKEGEMQYFVNGIVVTIPQGQGIFVNANRLHYGFSEKKKECFYECLVFHPSLFGTPETLTGGYLRQLTDDASPDYLLLADERTLSLIQKIMELYETQPEWFELTVLSLFSGLIGEIHRQMKGNREEETEPEWVSLRRMVGYLQKNYTGTIRLEEVAAAGTVCRSKCCRLFREKLGTTPMGYLNRYRLEKAREKLISTGETVTAIAGSCGFDNPSYFTEMFRKMYGESPREVRKKLHRL